MRLLTEVLDDVDTPQDVREMLVQESAATENGRDDVVSDDVCDRRKILDREENGFVDDSEEEDPGSEGEGSNEDNDESSEDIAEDSDTDSLEDGLDVVHSDEERKGGLNI